MFGNSLAGLHGVVGEQVTLRRVTASAYSTATGGVTPTVVDVPVARAVLRALTGGERRQLEAAGVATAQQMCVIPAGSLAESEAPTVRDLVVTAAGVLWTVLRVDTETAGGVVINWLLALQARTPG